MFAKSPRPTRRRGAPSRCKFGALLESQRHHRIHPGRSAGWDVSGEQGHGSHHQNGQPNPSRVVRPQAEKQSLCQPRGGQSAWKSRRNPDHHQRERFANHHPHDIASFSAQRHADADFVAPALDHVRDHAIEADCGEQCGEQAEET